jgi:hypothetical protein
MVETVDNQSVGIGAVTSLLLFVFFINLLMDSTVNPSKIKKGNHDHVMASFAQSAGSGIAPVTLSSRPSQGDETGSEGPN